MQKLIDNKYVALVGNAESLFDFQYGSEIDDHQVVIRINDTAIFHDDLTPRHSQGTKIDIWAFWDVYRFITSQSQYRTKRTDEFFYKGKFKKLNLCMGMREKGFELNDKEFGLDIKQQCRKELGNPSTGLVLLYLLDNMNPKEVNVYGFDFKKTKTFSQATNLVDENRYDTFYRHDFKFEEQYCMQKFFTQQRFNLKGY